MLHIEFFPGVLDLLQLQFNLVEECVHLGPILVTHGGYVHYRLLHQVLLLQCFRFARLLVLL